MYYLFATVNVTMGILLGLSLLEKQRKTKVKITSEGIHYES
jgi:hypothetical protein